MSVTWQSASAVDGPGVRNLDRPQQCGRRDPDLRPRGARKWSLGRTESVVGCSRPRRAPRTPGRVRDHGRSGDSVEKRGMGCDRREVTFSLLSGSKFSVGTQIVHFSRSLDLRPLSDPKVNSWVFLGGPESPTPSRTRRPGVDPYRR